MPPKAEGACRLELEAYMVRGIREGGTVRSFSNWPEAAIAKRLTGLEADWSDPALFMCSLVELLSFVNTGECSGLFMSMIWPFVDGRWAHLDKNPDPAEQQAKAFRGPRSWPDRRRRVHETLRDALRAQLQKISSKQAVSIPTQPMWTRKMFARLNGVDAAITVGIWRWFDDVLRYLGDANWKIRQCDHCGIFHLPKNFRGATAHYCSPQHRPRRDEAQYSRERRAQETRMRVRDNAEALKVGVDPSAFARKRRDH